MGCLVLELVLALGAAFHYALYLSILQPIEPLGVTSLNEEEIIQFYPDVIIVIDTEIDHLLECYKSQQFCHQLKAVQNHQVYVFDYYGFIIPRSIEAIA